LGANNGQYIGNSRSSTGSAIDIGYFEILGALGGLITPANYDNCRGSAAGFDWRGAGEFACRRAATNTKPGHNLGFFVYVKYFSDFYISYRRRILTRRETDNMELVIQLILIVCGEDGPIIAAPKAGR